MRSEAWNETNTRTAETPSISETAAVPRPNAPPRSKTAQQVQRRFEAIKQRQGKKVVTFVGFSGAGYEDPKAVEEYIRSELSALGRDEYIVNGGLTKDGIGMAYDIADDMGFETAGIVSEKAREYAESFADVDYPFIVRDTEWGGRGPDGKLTPTSEAMVGTSDLMIGISGNDVARDEMVEARRRGIPTRFHIADMNHAKARAKAKRKGLREPTRASLRGTAHEELAT